MQSGAGLHAFATDDAYREAGAEVVDGDVLAGADVVLTVSPLTVAQAAGCCSTARSRSASCRSVPNAELVALLRERDVLALRDGAGAAHLPGAVDGRAVVAGAGRRLPRRAGRGRAAAAVLPAVHDGGRHRRAGRRCWSSAPASPACRRSPPRAGSVPSSRRTTCAPRRPTRCARWARRSSTSDSSRSRATGGYAREMSRGAGRAATRAAHAVRRRSRRRHHHRGGARAGRRRCW